MLPKFVKRAMDHGYEITHIAVLFYFKMPTDNPTLLGFAQSLTLAVEHALTFGLWTMYGRWTNCEYLAL